MSHQAVKSLILISMLLIAGCNFGRGMRAPRPHEQFDRYGRNTTDAEIHDAGQICIMKHPYPSGDSSNDEKYNANALYDRCFYESGFRAKKGNSRGLCGDERFQYLPACIQWKSDEQLLTGQ